MCENCGCSNKHQFTLITSEEESHAHHHHEDNQHTQKIDLNQNILSKNNLLASKNRGFFQGRKCLAINFVSSPGSGKTSLLEKTICALKKELNFYVIEGDQQTSNDADRISKTGAKAIQINTGDGCHLDAHMVSHAIETLAPTANSIIFIENVGNLVCPTLFDLGEAFRVVIMSVTEGEDKPLKYPGIFASSQICIVNKTDLLPYVDFNMDNAIKFAQQVNPNLLFFKMSVKTGEGLPNWTNWISSSADILK